MFITSLYVSCVYGLGFLFYTTLNTTLIANYGWRPEICGLQYLWFALGYFIVLGIVAKISDATVARRTMANNGVFEPEMRLPACVFFAMFVPVIFFWYGWAAERNAFWIVTCLALVPFGIGTIGVMIPVQAYLIDAYPVYASSAVVACIVLRSLFGASLALMGPTLNQKLGLGWANTMLGLIMIAMVQTTMYVARNGKALRAKYNPTL